MAMLQARHVLTEPPIFLWGVTKSVGERRHRMQRSPADTYTPNVELRSEFGQIALTLKPQEFLG